jgi:hypothetical protein
MHFIPPNPVSAIMSKSNTISAPPVAQQVGQYECIYHSDKVRLDPVKFGINIEMVAHKLVHRPDEVYNPKAGKGKA